MDSAPLRIVPSFPIALLFLCLFLCYPQAGQTQDAGERIFNTFCIACHTIGGGKLIGPDLDGIHEKRSQEWLEGFIKSSQSMINAGDPEAVALYKEYNSMLMPDAIATDEEIRQVIGYMKSRSSDASAQAGTVAGGAAPADAVAAEPGQTGSAPAEPGTPDEPPSQEEILVGQDLFQGKIRLANGGPACNACHDVRHDAVIGGGILAMELTSSFSRMGRPGVTAILGRAPYPVMQAAYQNSELTDEEVSALVAFLEYADSEQFNQLPRDYGIGLFLSGTAGAGVLFAFFGFVWRGRKRESVNQAIFDRQIRSVSDDEY